LLSKHENLTASCVVVVSCSLHLRGRTVLRFCPLVNTD